MSNKKPPIGLTPEYIHNYNTDRDRIIEIVEAIKRYSVAEIPIPLKWVDELDRRILAYTTPTPMDLRNY